jgi:hypothetical protein
MGFIGLSDITVVRAEGLATGEPSIDAALNHGRKMIDAYGLTVASRKPGANCNALMSTRSDTVEPLGYMSRLSSMPVEVERIEAS